jgi:hypothetical protein
MRDDVVTALACESRALSGVLHGLTPEDFARPTNCPPWNLQELVVHTADSIRVSDAPSFAPAEPTAEPRTTADYYRRPERDTRAYRQGNVDHTRQLARTVLADTTALRWFDDVSRHSVATLERQDLDRAVLIPRVGAMRLADWVVTRVISVAAHGLDVAITLDRTPWTTPEALRAMRPVFVDALLDSRPPDAVGWDDATLLAAATGRRALTDRDRERLGPFAQRFPLLS